MLDKSQVSYLHLVNSTTNSKYSDLLLSDVWTSEALGLKTCPGWAESKLYFHQIQPTWFKELAKKYIYYRASTAEFSTICVILKTLKFFGRFLFNCSPKITDASQINVTGEVIKSEFTELDNNVELQWMRKKVLGEVLSNGYCALPANLNCSKGNACLQCGDFRTTQEFLDQHKQHQKRTQQALELASQENWQRQVQVNKEVLNNLNKIINELEKDS